MYLYVLYGVALGAFPLSVAGNYDYGYWNVTVDKAWSASGHRSWILGANYSGTPGLTTHSSWTYSPVNGSTITIHNDPNFDATFNDSGKITISQSVFIADHVAVGVHGNGTIECKTNPAGRSCSGFTQINAICLGERCLP
ncbi:hypothetical protein F5Y10DRAFT_235181 [Nemania abortiva]|nr:hypothetical protein F5Y10DRAFT_235181 [Nemania abortiva]